MNVFLIFLNFSRQNNFVSKDVYKSALDELAAAKNRIRKLEDLVKEKRKQLSSQKRVSKYHQKTSNIRKLKLTRLFKMFNLRKILPVCEQELFRTLMPHFKLLDD